MRYDSPTQGTIAFGSTGPLTASGQDVPLHATARSSNPFGEAESGASAVTLHDGPASLTLDTSRWTRTAEIRHGR